MNSIVRPIFNKKVTVKFVKLVNNGRMHCSRENSQKLWLKKKKKGKHANRKMQMRNVDPNPT